MTDITSYLQQITLPARDSHKGQNGKLLIIGGSELFHAASKWSLDIASTFVDMVFYASVPSNNELVQAAKGEFWNGIVIGRSEVENYLLEADCILIGPGMERTTETQDMVNGLLQKYPAKKWVIDAGALQMVEVRLLNQNCIVTPHQKEFADLYQKCLGEVTSVVTEESVTKVSQSCMGATLVVKGVIDIIAQGSHVEKIDGGNAGMTKGGTGDVLAGLIAGLYATQDAVTAAVVGSYINKKAGDALYEKVGPYFNASDLVKEIPTVMWTLLKN